MSRGIRDQAREVIRWAVGRAPADRISDAFALVGGLFNPPISPRVVREAYSGGPCLGLATAERIVADQDAALQVYLTHIEAQLQAWQYEKERVKCRLAQVGEYLCEAAQTLEYPAAGTDEGSPSASSSTTSLPLLPQARASSPGSRGERIASHNGSRTGRSASRADLRTAEGW